MGYGTQYVRYKNSFKERQFGNALLRGLVPDIVVVGVEVPEEGGCADMKSLRCGEDSWTRFASRWRLGYRVLVECMSLNSGWVVRKCC